MTEKQPPARTRKPESSGGANRRANGRRLMAVDVTPEQSLRYHHASKLAGFGTLREWIHARLGGLPEVVKAAESFPDAAASSAE